MSRKHFVRVGLTTVLIGMAPFMAAAQQGAAGPSPQAATIQQPDYHPSASDLMNIGVQPRHVKIALALREQNWAYLAYETNELKGAFARIARTVPMIDGKFDTAALVESTIAPQLKDLADAVKAKDVAKSTAGFAALTASCNACHQAVSHGVIVIKVPTAAFFPDQEFGIPKPQ